MHVKNQLLDAHLERRWLANESSQINSIQTDIEVM